MQNNEKQKGSFSPAPFMHGTSPQTGTVWELFRQGVSMLSTASVTNATNECLWLLESTCNLSRLDIYQNPSQRMSSEQWNAAMKLVRRRASGEPLQYILGTQEFYGLELNIPHGVFIPRPETELIVDALRQQPLPAATPSIADVGTGSGCLAVALAVQDSRFTIYATDRCPLACATAQHNAHRHQVADQVTVWPGHLLTPLASRGLQGTLSAIVSNPPYIPTAALATLPVDVREHEPWHALDGGQDGLDVYRDLLREALDLLLPHGILILEAGAGQASQICEEAERHGAYSILQIQQDFAGIDRVITLERKGSHLV
ncbi:MAG: peptide chain release factor N(5)-glutamine methyltransferase [Nitrospirales bacterium]|nr:peptide chain release factor N(5)-glutamine methyltransferase [Nitrospirales bacterium]